MSSREKKQAFRSPQYIMRELKRSSSAGVNQPNVLSERVFENISLFFVVFCREERKEVNASRRLHTNKIETQPMTMNERNLFLDFEIFLLSVYKRLQRYTMEYQMQRFPVSSFVTALIYINRLRQRHVRIHAKNLKNLFIVSLFVALKVNEDLFDLTLDEFSECVHYHPHITIDDELRFLKAIDYDLVVNRNDYKGYMFYLTANMSNE